MTNRELDQRIGEILQDVRHLCTDLQQGEPTVERAIALGALSACSTILDSLLPEDIDQLELVALGLIEVVPPKGGEVS